MFESDYARIEIKISSCVPSGCEKFESDYARIEIRIKVEDLVRVANV